MVKLGNDWDEKIGREFEKEYYLKLRNFLKEEYASHTVFPDMYDLFSALKATAYSKVKVVILGQDPYHEPGQAHGMAFSVKPGVQIPPSLLNMYKEINSEFGYPIPKTGYLMKWAEQGVLLLNTVLTVRSGEANSHQNKGWENFTDEVIRQLNARRDGIVFLLWGNNAKKKKELITNPQHLILETVHPSPLSASRGFMGCGHFKKANEFLISNLKSPIDWQITD
ncbi:MAG: uracil-DNA glycosylase [Ruminococcaceae bacterium]|nr:uracil-DNA glycosylase [Oscillospiraceae bacterium]